MYANMAWDAEGLGWTSCDVSDWTTDVCPNTLRFLSSSRNKDRPLNRIAPYQARTPQGENYTTTIFQLVGSNLQRTKMKKKPENIFFLTLQGISELLLISLKSTEFLSCIQPLYGACRKSWNAYVVPTITPDSKVFSRLHCITNLHMTWYGELESKQKTEPPIKRVIIRFCSPQ